MTRPLTRSADMTLLTLVKTPVEAVAKGLKVLQERISPKALLFEEHGTIFAAVDQDPGRLVLGYGSTIEEAVLAAVAKHEG